MWWTKESQCAPMVSVDCWPSVQPNAQTFPHSMNCRYQFCLLCFRSTNLVVQRSHVATIRTIFCMGLVAGVADIVFGWFCAFGCTAEHRLRHTRNENDFAWRCAQGVLDIQDAGGQSDWIDRDTGQRHAIGQRSEWNETSKFYNFIRFEYYL